MGRGSRIDHAARPAKRREAAISSVVVLAGQKGQERVLLVAYDGQEWRLPHKSVNEGGDLRSSAETEVADLLGVNAGQLSELRRSGPQDNLFISKLRMTVPISSDGSFGRWFSVSDLPELDEKEIAAIDEALASIRS